MWRRVAGAAVAGVIICGCGATAAGGPAPNSGVGRATSIASAPPTGAVQGVPAPGHFIPFAPLPPAGLYPSPPLPSATPMVLPSGTSACRAGQVEAAYGGSGGATGHVVQSIRLRNKSRTVCFIDGYPEISILDPSGRLLARAAGTANRGTLFDEGWSGPVLMSVDTPSLPATSGGPVTGPAPTGQAFLNVEWYDCAHRHAAQLRLSLLSGGGDLIIAFPIDGPFGAQCDGSTEFVGLYRGPLTPLGWSPPSPHYRKVRIGLVAPASVARGTTLVYYVTLNNTDVDTYSLDPCADYNEFVGPKTVSASYRLDCSGVGELHPGASVSFQVELQIPPTVPLGSATLTWALIDGRFSIPSGEATIDITD
jgi:hypothetical protein